MVGRTGGSAVGVDARPRLVSRRRGQPIFLVVLLGLCAAFGVVALGLVVLVLPDATGTARVIGPVPGTDKTRIEVLDGPDPRTWRVPNEDVDGAQPGDVIDVRLGGSCECVPQADIEGTGIVILGSVFLIVLFAVVLRGYLRYRVSRRSQMLARRAITTDAWCTPVQLRPVLSGTGKRVAVAVDVWAVEGQWLGHIDLGQPLPRFDPRQNWWLVGQPVPGNSVALISEGRTQVVLPDGPLVAGAAEEPPWSAVSVEALGWGRPPAAPELPGQGRITVSALPRDGDDPVLEGALANHRAVATRGAGIALLAWLGGTVALFAGAPWYLVVPVVIAVQFGGTRVAHRNAAKSAAELVGLDPSLESYAPQVSLALLLWSAKGGFSPLWKGPFPTLAT